MRKQQCASTIMLPKSTTLSPIKSPILKETVTQTSLHFKIANHTFLVARQRKILHPDIKEPRSLRMFESEDHEMYFPRSLSLNLLNGGRFCEFHNSPRFNPLQMDLWQRIQKAIDSTLSMDNQADLRSPVGQYLLKKYLEEMSQVLQTNHIPLFEPGDFGPEMVGPVPVDTTCPGQLSPTFSLAGG